MGKTKLGNELTISKGALRIATIGEIDELNAFIGLAKAFISARARSIVPLIVRIQQELQIINSQLALAKTTKKITANNINILKKEITAFNAKLPKINKFILPGADIPSAHLHIARAVCRRAERTIVQLAQIENCDKLLIEYLNKLNTWLFTAARYMETKNETK
jgi:cob(I)alamin adenosyltransferase